MSRGTVRGECVSAADGGRGGLPQAPETGVLGGAQTDFFENLDAGEEALIADAAPFRARPTPVGGSRRGVPNKRNAQLRDLYLKSGMPHPVLWMGSVLRMGVDGLAEALGCKTVEAMYLMRKIAADAAPYIESRQPTRVDVPDGARRAVLVVGELEDAARAVEAARVDGVLAIDDDLPRALREAQQDQRLAAAPAAGSHGEGSHDDAQAIDDAGE